MKKTPLAAVLSVNWSNPAFRIFDFSLAIGAIVYGWWFDVPLDLWCGVAGLVFSLINPMGRLQKLLAGFRG